MHDLDKIAQECIREVKAAQIPAQDDRIVLITAKKMKDWGVCVATPRRFEIHINLRMLSDQCPVKSLKETVIHELIHTCPDAYDHGELFRHYARIMDERYGYEVLSESDEDAVFHPDMPVLRRLVCPKCGVHSDIRSKEQLRVYEERRERGLHDFCSFCESAFLDEAYPEKPEVHDLEQYAKECIDELKAAGVPVRDSNITKISTDYLVERGYWGYCFLGANEQFRILISRELLQGDCPVDRLKEALILELLHTCKGCKKQGKTYAKYAKHMEEVYGYHLWEVKDWDAIYAPEKPVLHTYVCTTCGAKYPARRKYLYPDEKKAGREKLAKVFRCAFCRGLMHEPGGDVEATVNKTKRQYGGFVVWSAEIGKTWDME